MIERKYTFEQNFSLTLVFLWKSYEYKQTKTMEQLKTFSVTCSFATSCDTFGCHWMENLTPSVYKWYRQQRKSNMGREMLTKSGSMPSIWTRFPQFSTNSISSSRNVWISFWNEWIFAMCLVKTKKRHIVRGMARKIITLSFCGKGSRCVIDWMDAKIILLTTQKYGKWVSREEVRCLEFFKPGAGGRNGFQKPPQLLFPF